MDLVASSRIVALEMASWVDRPVPLPGIRKIGQARGLLAVRAMVKFLGLALVVGCVTRSEPAGGTPGKGDGPGAACNADVECAAGLSCEANICLTPPSLTFTNNGGAVISNMNAWTIVWAGDEPLGAKLDAFHAAALASTYWTSTVAEYGVGAGEAKGVLVSGVPLSRVTDASFYEDVVADAIGRLATPPNSNTVFVVLLPAAIPSSVVNAGYYHSVTSATYTSVDGTALTVPYIVDIQQNNIPSITNFENLTWGDSHELVETATDPRWPAAFQSPWLQGSGEVADLCWAIPVAQTLADGGSYLVTRAYSASRAAARQGDACVPTMTEPYANIAVEPSAIAIPHGVGQETHVQLVAFSSATAAAQPSSMMWSLHGDASYRISPASGTLLPGETADITITRVHQSPAWPTPLDLWVTDPDNPDIPRQEWYAGIAFGP
jgi:hypothetical protein